MHAAAITKPQSTTHSLRRIRRREEWRALLSDYDSSDLSQKAFCELHQLSMSSFYQWKKKLTVELPSDNFIDITPQPDENFGEPSAQSSSAYQVELELGNGIILRVRGT